VRDAEQFGLHQSTSRVRGNLIFALFIRSNCGGVFLIYSFRNTSFTVAPVMHKICVA
jgi:hypothetical protein